MKIAVFNGSNKKGCTWNVKNLFLKNLGDGNTIKEFFMPKDLPNFCNGCAACAIKGIEYCPHYEFLKPIRSAIEQSDLLVFTSPVYVFHITGALKNLLDHLFVYWMPHRPEGFMQKKQAVVITASLGMGNNSTAKTINHSLDYWGVARRYSIGVRLMDSIYWEQIPDKRKIKFESKCAKVAEKVKLKSKKVGPRFKIKMQFRLFTMTQKIIGKKHGTSLDYVHWKTNGYLDGKKPSKD